MKKAWHWFFCRHTQKGKLLKSHNDYFIVKESTCHWWPLKKRRQNELYYCNCVHAVISQHKPYKIDLCNKPDETWLIKTDTSVVKLSVQPEESVDVHCHFVLVTYIQQSCKSLEIESFHASCLAHKSTYEVIMS